MRMGRWLSVVLIGLVVWPTASRAGDVKVLSAGATRMAVTDLVGAFQAETGHTVTVTFGTAAELRKKLASGEAWDAVIVPDEVLDQMTAQGLVTAGTRTLFGRSGMGVGMRAGAALPDISTPEALRRTLIKVSSLTYVEGTTSGRHFAEVLRRLDIAEAVKDKTRLLSGGRPAELVATGEVELVVHQISEIIPVKGVTLVGPLPRELQKVTAYSAGLPRQSAAPDQGRKFIAFVTSPAFKTKLAAAGLDYRD